MATSTFRRDTTSGLMALGQAFIAANPTLAIRVYPRRPGGFTGDLPCMYVGTRNESILVDSGIWTRTMEPQMVLVGHPTGTPDEVADEMDVLTDAFLSYCTANPHALGANTVMGSRIGVRDFEIEIDNVVYPAVVVTLGDSISAGGRS